MIQKLASPYPTVLQAKREGLLCNEVIRERWRDYRLNVTLSPKM
jgi:hypothetical protein